MKQLKTLALLTIFWFTAGFAGAQELQYNINGIAKNANPNDYAKLLRWSGENYEVVDSILINNSAFNLAGKLCHPEMAYIEIGNYAPYPVFLNNETFFINVDLDKNKSLKIKGGKSQQTYTKFQSELDSFDILLEQLDREYAISEKNKRAYQSSALQASIDTLHINRALFIKNFVVNNYTSDAAPYITSKYLLFDLTNKELKHYVNLFEENLSYEPIVIALNEKANNNANTEIGAIAPSFFLPASNGKMIDLQEYRGKYVLINFWASWCNPCRKDASSLVHLYDKYKGLNIEFINISIDTDKQRWLKSIKEDSYTWIQCCDLQGFQSSIVKIYSVSNIPYTILIDPKGKIIAKPNSVKNTDIELNKIAQ